MFIVHQLARILGLLFGITLGGGIIMFGSAWGGIPIGLALGIALGWLAALLPPEIVRHAILLSLRWSDSHHLKERLAREHELAPMILEVLVARGEPVEQFREQAQTLLRSDSMLRRSIGRKISRKWFPDLLLKQLIP